jgi:hypothetical protein
VEQEDLLRKSSAQSWAPRTPARQRLLSEMVVIEV